MSQPIPAEHLILFAEASKETRERYQTLLEETGYTVAAVPRDEAATASRQLRPSLIVLQLDDPAQTGLGLVRGLRTQAETRSTPLVVLIRFDDLHTREQIVRAGASAIVIDPVKAAALRRLLRRLLGRAIMSGITPDASSRRAAALTDEVTGV